MFHSSIRCFETNNGNYWARTMTCEREKGEWKWQDPKT